MKVKVAQKRIDAIAAAMSRLDPETTVIDVAIYDQPKIQLSGYRTGFDGMKRMAEKNAVLLNVDPGHHQTGDDVYYMDGDVKVFAIITSDK